MIPNLPKYVFIDDSTLVRTTLSNIIRSDMEVGPQKTRKIQSVPMFNISMQISIHKKNFSNFRSWYLNEVGSGALWFLMFDPIDGTQRRFRFTEGELQWTKSGNLFRSSIVLEAYDEL